MAKINARDFINKSKQQIESFRQADEAQEEPFGLPKGTQVEKGPLLGEAGKIDARKLLEELKRDTAGPPIRTGQFSDDPVGIQSLLDAEKRFEIDQKLASEGVSTTKGADARLRLEKEFTPPDRLNQFLETNFDSSRLTEDGRLIVSLTDKQGVNREFLFDESQLSMADFADLGEEFFTAAGAIGGLVGFMKLIPSLVSTPGVINLATLAVIGGVSGQLGASMGDVAVALKNEGVDDEFISNLVKSRGIKAVEDTLLDFLFAGTLRVGGKLISPNAEQLRGKSQEAITAAQKRFQEEGFDIDLTPGVRTLDPTLQQAEALRERLPGSARPSVRRKLKETEGLTEIQESFTPRGTPSTAIVGEQIRSMLLKDKSMKEKVVENIRSQASRKIKETKESLGNKISTKGLTAIESGQLVRAEALDEVNRFELRQTLLEDNLDNQIAQISPLPQVRDFVRTPKMKSQLDKLSRELLRSKSITKETVQDLDRALGGRKNVRVKKDEQIIKELANRKLLSFIEGLKKLPDNVSYRRLRSFRSELDEIVRNPDRFPGVAIGRIKKVRSIVQDALKKSVDADSPVSQSVKDAANLALDHFSSNIDRLEAPLVSGSIRKIGEAGFIQDSGEVLPNLIARGEVERAQQLIDVIGSNSDGTRASRRAAFDIFFEKDTMSTLGDGVFNASSVAKRLDSMSPEHKRLMFGDDVSVGEVERLIRLKASNDGTLGGIPQAFGSAEIDIRDQLLMAARKDAELQSFNTSVINRLLNNESDNFSALDPASFIRNNLKTMSRKDLTKLMAMMPPNIKKKFRLAVIGNLFERAGKGFKPGEQLGDFVKGKKPVPINLRKVMTSEAFGADGKETELKLATIVGSNQFKRLRSFATILDARRSKESSIAGAFAGSNLILNLISGGDARVSGIKDAIRFRIASILVDSDIVGDILTRKGFKPSVRNKALQAAIPQISRLVFSQLGEGSQAIEFMDFVRDKLGLNRLDELQKKRKRLGGRTIMDVQSIDKPAQISTLRGGR